MGRLAAATVLPNSALGGTDDIAVQLSLLWGWIKAPLIVPLLNIAVFLCLIMSLMLLIERVYMSIVILLLKLSGRSPETRYKFQPMKEDVELGNSSYPMVLVQIPMFNEREVLFFFPSFWFFIYVFLCLLSKFMLFTGYTHFKIKLLQVYQLSIGAACGLSWPSDRLIIQVLDDSTDLTIKVLQNYSKLNNNYNYPNENIYLICVELRYNLHCRIWWS